MIPRPRIGYEIKDKDNKKRGGELAIIISYPASASEITVLLKHPENNL